MTTIKLTSSQYHLLCEALRRFECFAVRRDNRKWRIGDLRAAWTGLGYASDYKSVVDAGLMVSVHGIWPRAIGWYQLTEKGARIILQWHKAGYKCGKRNYELTVRPPRSYEINQPPKEIKPNAS